MKRLSAYALVYGSLATVGVVFLTAAAALRPYGGAGQGIGGEKVDITDVDPQPDGSPDPEPKISPTIIPSTVGDTGTL